MESHIMSTALKLAEVDDRAELSGDGDIHRRRSW
jgi:hypothetical protein